MTSKKRIYPGDLTGLRFGKLTVIKHAGVRDSGVQLWLCKCDCGNEKVIIRQNLTTGKTTSCGCARLYPPDGYNFARFLEDGKTRTHIYSKWVSLRSQANKLNKLVTICDEWNTFGAFYEWSIANGYSDGDKCILRRINTNKPFSPDNCCWLTKQEYYSTLPLRNGGGRTLITYRGLALNISGWAKLIGVTTLTLRRRIKKLGTTDMSVICQEPFNYGYGGQDGTKTIDIDEILENAYDGLLPRPQKGANEND